MLVSRLKTRLQSIGNYRIVRDLYAGYEVQRLGLMGWYQVSSLNPKWSGINTNRTLEEAEELVERCLRFHEVIKTYEH